MAGSALHLSTATEQPLTDPPTALREAWGRGTPNPLISSDRKISGNVLSVSAPIVMNSLLPYEVSYPAHSYCTIVYSDQGMYSYNYVIRVGIYVASYTFFGKVPYRYIVDLL